MLKVALTYDVEENEFIESGNGRERIEQLVSDRRLFNLLNNAEVRRTCFILGSWLYQRIRSKQAGTIEEIFGGPFSDIQSHGFAHLPILSERGTPYPMRLEDLSYSLSAASHVIYSAFDLKPVGFRPPYGCSRDLSDEPEILDILSKAGVKFVSSDLRGKGINPLYTSLSMERQPYIYEGYSILEIPSDGWQDTAFLSEKQRKYGKAPKDFKGITEYYKGLFEKALRLTEKAGQTIHVVLCLHPWAIKIYDENLDIHKWLTNHVRQLGGEFVTCSDIAREFGVIA